MSMRMIGFFVAIVIALVLLVTYVVRRGSWAAGLGLRARRALLAVAITVLLMPLAVRFLHIAPNDTVAAAMTMSGFGLALAMVIAAALMLPVDLLARAVARFRRPVSSKVPLSSSVPAPDPIPDPVPPPPLSRRDFLARTAVGGAIAVGTSTSLYGVLFGRHDYVLEQVPIVLRNLPRTLDGYTIVQLSDLHVGMFVGERELSAAVDLVRRARPDLIVLTGDLIDHDPSHIPALGRFARRLAELGARDGVVAIAGNHDYYTGVDRVLGTLRDAGTSVLRNDGRVIGDRGGAFALLGVDDVWAQRNGYGRHADLAASIAQVPPDLARVLLCHNPELFPAAAAHVDLQLSGHTHGGQVNIVVRPADLVLGHGFIAGHYALGDAQIYVNRGFGTAGPPARIGAAPEVSRIVLASA